MSEQYPSVVQTEISLKNLSVTTATQSGAWITLFLLTIVYAVNIADRYVLSTLIEPIKHEFQLSDSAVGFLTGTALAIFYVCAGLPLGALADKASRKKMIAISVTIWSAMTVVSGVSANFWHLLLARIGVGIGEAGGTPPSHSILSDKFTERLRVFALSVFGIGASIGGWLGASAAGYLNEAYGWRETLIIFGLCGLPVALLVWLFVPEPKRGQIDTAAKTVALEHATLKDSIQFIWRSKALFHVMAGATIITFWGWGILWWTPSFLVRSYTLTVGDAGAMLGPIHGIAGTLLMVLTVLVMFQLRNKAVSKQPSFIAWTTVLGTFLSIAVFLTDKLDYVHILLWLFVPITYIYIGPTTGLVQNLLPPQMRAKGAAILLFVANIANLAIAPQLIGFGSDVVGRYLEHPEESLRYVLLGCAVTGFWAAYHYWAAARHIQRGGEGVN